MIPNLQPEPAVVVQKQPGAWSHPRSGLRTAARWLAFAALFFICVHRIMEFRPLPFDAPGTVRPALYSLFRSYVALFPSPQDAWYLWDAACYVAILTVPLLALLNYFRSSNAVVLPGRLGRVLCSPGVFWLAYAVCLLVCRYPVIITKELNPDEGEFLSSAFKLFYDPIYFHAADSNTSGPGNIYPLMWPAALGLSPDFASGRILAAAAIFFSIYLLYRAARLVAADGISRLAILPLALAFPAFSHTELTYNSSEHIPFLLVSLALFLSVRIFVRPHEYRLPIFLIGTLVSVVFLTKLQASPMIATAGLVSLAFLLAKTGRRATLKATFLFAGGAVAVMLVNAFYCLKAGVWDDFLERYVLANIDYSDPHAGFLFSLQTFFRYVLNTTEGRYLLIAAPVIAAVWLYERRRDALKSAGPFRAAAWAAAIAAATVALVRAHNPTFRLVVAVVYLAGGTIAVIAVPVYLVSRYRRGTPDIDPATWFGSLAVLSSGAAFYCVYKPHRAFVHYLFFLMIPLGMLIAWMVMRERRAARILPLTSAVVAMACATYLWHFRDMRAFKIPEKVGTPDADFIRSVTSPGGFIYVWGWDGLAYVSSARIPAAKQTQVANLFRGYGIAAFPPPYFGTRESERIRQYYIDHELQELKNNPPELFVDAACSRSWFLNSREYYSFEQFPGFKNFVDSNYVFVKEQDEERFYLRRDLTWRLQPARAGLLPGH